MAKKRPSRNVPAKKPARRRKSAARDQAGPTLPPRESLRWLMDFAPIVLWAVDARGVFTISEGAGLARLNLKPAQVVGQSVFDMYADVPAVLNNVRRALRGEHVASTIDVRGSMWETRYLPLQGPRGRGGRVRGVLGLSVDVTDRERTRTEAERSQERLALIYKRSPVGIIAWDMRFCVRQWNPAAAAIFGIPETDAIGMHASRIVPGAARDQVDRVWAELSQAAGGERSRNDNLTADGRTITCEWYNAPLRDDAGNVVGAVSMVQDVTAEAHAQAELARHREHLEHEVQARTRELSEQAEKLRQSERLAALGTLAAGLGHDINNVLLPMRCWVDSLRARAAPLGLPAAEEIASLTTSLNFLGQLARSLLTLAASTDDLARMPARTDVGAWWRQEQAMLRGSLPHPIELTMTIDPGLPLLRIASDQLTRAMLNLLVNAAEAAGPTDKDGPGAGRRGGASRGTVHAFARLEGGMVALGVTDNGPGMTPEVRKHALDPFFTTKKRALSTGLGLSLVHAVAKTAGGGVRIDSAPGQGTTVAMLLPVATHPDRAGEAGGAGFAAAGALHGPPRPRPAWVSVADEHTAGYLLALLNARGFTAARLERAAAPAATDVWITDPRGLALAQRLARGDRLPWTIVIGRAGPEWKALGARVVSDQTDIEAIAGALP